MPAPALVRIVFMGDSITSGQYVDTNLRWTGLVTDRLIRKYLDTPVNLLALNKGISGETTRMGLERYPQDVQNHRPDVVTLQFAHNDCNCWLTDAGVPRVSPAGYRANLIEMVERTRRFGARHIILSTSHPTLRFKTMISGEKYEEANARYSAILADVAEETGVTLCDIRAVFARYSAKEMERMLMPYPDQLHLSVEGNEIYANTIWPLVERAVTDVLAQQGAR